VEVDEHALRREEPRHLGVEVDERRLLDERVLEDLAEREPVAAAADEDARAARADERDGRVDERLVVAELVLGAELEVAVQEEPEVALGAREDDPLVARLLGEDDRRVEEVVLEDALDMLPDGEPAREHERGEERL